ncbi:beta-1,3-galactosyltransferase 6 [Toxorhynchites rutilus septentrionalis]|uniref:beta-1,3-galactosyltransferase 6 n=1 Tax=Toxorhynchites rutilus septentrionalis TaxID=329112 RepID=UPI0024798AF9|nr:beta-1,3-galactosyltransferase 6 [Toxorhynchites rutilus septentrionalis]
MKTMAFGRYHHLHKRNCMGMLPIFCSFLAGALLTLLIGGPNQSCEPSGRVYETENSYFLMLLIVSAPGNVERRKAIRETYLNLRPRMLNESYQDEVIYVPTSDERGQLHLESTQTQRDLLDNYRQWRQKQIKNVKVMNFKVKALFAIGVHGLSRAERKAIYEEQRVYSDVLELDDLKDSYSNLTTKIFQSMNKIDKVYDFKYLMKLDDDTYLKLDLLSEDLLSYYEKMHKMRSAHRKPIELYWGYFKGASTIQQRGQWKESNYKLCDRYLPYALGGGYVLSKNLVTFIATHGASLSNYRSEDMAVGTWLSPFGNIHRRHDVRFDTAWMARKCQEYHIVLHKRTAQEMMDYYQGKQCVNTETQVTQRPKEYFYDWTVPPSQCCKVLV